MWVLLRILLLIGLAYILTRAVEFLIDGIHQCSVGKKWAAYGLTAVLVATATSIPELIIGIMAGLNKTPNLALGMVLGSNIANISMVVGLAALISGSISAKGEVLKKELIYGFLIGCLPLVMLMDKTLSRLDGLALVLVYIWFTWDSLERRQKRQSIGWEMIRLKRGILLLLGRHSLKEKGLKDILIGSVVMVAAAKLIVMLAEGVADKMSIPALVVGIILVPIGSTLPELAFEIKSTGRREYMMVFGNLIGSLAANAGLILGIVALISPIHLETEMKSYLIGQLAFVILFGIFWMLAYSKRWLERWEGLLLVMLYWLFVIVEFMVK